VLLGTRPLPEDTSFILADYLRSHGRSYTADDMETAFTLYIQEKLDVRVERDDSLSSRLIERVMRSYSRYLMDRRREEEVEEEPEPMKKEDIDNSARRILREMIEKVKQGQQFDSPSWTFLHSWLMEEGQLMPLDPDDREEYETRARIIWMQRLQDKRDKASREKAKWIHRYIKEAIEGKHDRDMEDGVVSIVMELKVRAWLEAIANGIAKFE